MRTPSHNILKKKILIKMHFLNIFFAVAQQ